MKVALIYPEVLDLARFKEKRKEFPPFGVLYLAAVIEQQGIDVRIIKISPGNTDLNLRGFDAIGYTIPSSATYGLVKLSRFNSIFSEDALIMVGGVHPSFYPIETLIDLKPHVVAFGEGEDTILELLLETNRKRFSKIDGVCFFSNGSVVKNPPRVINKDIDWLPLPARHLLDESDFIMQDRLSNTELRMAHVMFTRGCPFPCHFCAAARTRSQFRSGENARYELKHLIEKYEIDGFAVVDDNFIINKVKVADICDNIMDLGLKWSALSRVDTVDESLLTKMRDSGCIEIKYGVESGSEPLLQAMGKKITKEQIMFALRTTHNLGVKVKIFLIHGYPGENMETTNETIRLLEELKGMIERVSLFRFVPLPGTFVYNNPNLFNLRNTDRDGDFNDNWERYHIHHNNYHWWGSEQDFEELSTSYEKLKQVVDSL